jgi:glycosyltransferase 2 family protein
MLNATSVIARTVQARIGWNRIGLVVSLLIIAIAAVTLFRLLDDIEAAKVAAALQATSLRTILAAAGFVAVGYVTLTLYDFFALRTIGRPDVPYRIAALAGFTSYAIGHNLGATVFTGGAVRFRIYSAWGLGIIDVAKIAFVTGLTFWLGNAFMLGVGTAYAPEAASAVNQLPPWLNRAMALTGLMIVAAYLLWLRPRPRVIGRDDWQVALPNARLTLVQIGIGVLDLGAAALAMHALLPAQPSVDVVTVLVTFVTAALLGFLSHAPGGLGVLDAAMLIGFYQFEKEELLASLLIFRILYFVVPLFFAALILGARELGLSTRARASREIGESPVCLHPTDAASSSPVRAS